MKEQMIAYMKSFDLEIEEISLKYVHTLAVASGMKRLAKDLSLSEEEVELAEVLGLLHDIGRFEQWKKYHSYVDAKTVDHAAYGVQLLFEEGLLERFGMFDSETREILRFAILQHNRRTLETHSNPKVMLFSKMLRDIDKVDIYRVRLELDNYFLVEPSTKVYQDFMSNRAILLTDIQNKSDSLLCVMAFLYDVSFKETFHILKSSEHFSRFIDAIVVSEEVEDRFQEILSHIQLFLFTKEEK